MITRAPVSWRRTQPPATPIRASTGTTTTSTPDSMRCFRFRWIRWKSSALPWAAKGPIRVAHPADRWFSSPKAAPTLSTVRFTNTTATRRLPPTRGSITRPACRCSSWYAISSVPPSADPSGRTASSSSPTGNSASTPAAWRRCRRCLRKRSNRASCRSS